MDRIVHEKECQLTCTDTDKTVVAEVVDYRSKKNLIVNVSGNNIHLNYLDKHDIYVGSLSGLEFTTKGPKETVIHQGRIR